MMKDKNKLNEEKEALKSPHYSYYYARNVLKSRFEKGEDIISKSPHYSYCYARNVLKGRFEKGENAISKDDFYSELYKKHIYDKKSKKSKKPKKSKLIQKEIILIYQVNTWIEDAFCNKQITSERLYTSAHNEKSANSVIKYLEENPYKHKDLLKRTYRKEKLTMWTKQ